MTAITHLQLLVIGLLVVLRLMEREFGKYETPFDPSDRKMDLRLPMDRGRDNRPSSKDLTPRDYDPIAREQIRRLHDRRRQKNPDNGLRRRKSDQPK